MIIVGLGNVGDRYNGTFHNAGFVLADKLACRLALTFKDAPSLRCFLAEGNVSGRKVVIAKPKTFMNLSGECVKPLIERFKGDEDVIIAYDDVDLPLGATRFREKGSAGTHNGMRNVTALCGELPRVRLGIGKPHEGEELVSYVLKKLSKDALDKLDAAAEKAAASLEDYLRSGDRGALTRALNQS